MRPLTLSDPVGTRVLYMGRADPANVADASLVATGNLLGEGHPGTVARVDPKGGVCVSFLGLEHEPISDTPFLPDDDGRCPGLVAVNGEEWAAACSAGWWAAFV